MASPIKSSFEIVIIILPYALFHFSYCFENITLTNVLVFIHTGTHFIFGMGFGSVSVFMTF